MARRPRPARSAGKSGRAKTPKRTIKKPALKKAVGKKRSAKKAVSKIFPSGPHLVEAALAAFAHEVRTPLTGILAISSLLATSTLDEREARWVETIKTGAEHLSALSTLYVDAAKNATSTLRLHRDLFDLRAFARSVGDSLEGRATANGLTVQVTISEELPPFVLGDAVRLRAALENLIDNAVKFTASGAVGLDVSVVQRAKDKVKVTFAVADSGVGLSIADIKRLFRPFSQASIDIAARFGGAGLGLWSVKQLSRAMGGDVGVKSRQEGGTTFALTVGLIADDNVSSEAATTSFADAKGLRILSVEDNPFGRVVLNTILGELGHKVEFVGQGELVVQRLEGGQFDVVLMDMVLPGIDGVETIRRIRALGRPHGNIGVVGISGRDDDGDRARAAGADAFLPKPVSPRALAAALRAASGRAEASIA
jgi:two-component system, sensor histidine kinase